VTFEYRCASGHRQTAEFPAGAAAAHLPRCCYAACWLPPRRFFSADSLPQFGVDPFRAHHLSTRKEAAQATQQRYLDAPTDRVEARGREAAQGIRFIGDDTSGMTPKAQRAVEKYKAKKRDGQTV